MANRRSMEEKIRHYAEAQAQTLVERKHTEDGCSYDVQRTVTDEEKEVIGGVVMNIYQENGYKNRQDYLENLASDLDLDQELVFAAADLLGPTEDFDGLVTCLEDHAGGW